jgi:twitching motility protein PilT
MANFTIYQILKEAVDLDASDVHIKAGSRPIFRVHREMTIQDKYPVLSDEDVRNVFQQITTAHQREIFYNQWEQDFSFQLGDLARFRVNAYFKLGTVGLAFRWVRTRIPSFKQLNLPNVLRELSLKQDGLIVLTGPTGCGKSTTLAAMIDYMNQNLKRRIITIEDPVEYLHTDNKCIIVQREVGLDTNTFADALRHVLRQDPDVILVGEMRDLETATIALTAAETGHLVLTTLHTPSSYGAIDRLVDTFPEYQSQQVRLQLSTSLQAVIYQVLLPRADVEGVIPAVEVLIGTPAIRHLIREGQTFEIPTYLQSGKERGMQTLDDALAKLLDTGKITSREALSHMRNLNPAG